MWINELKYRVNINSIQLMQIKAENLLNPLRYHLSSEAKKRLRWMYILYYECYNNVSLAANKISASREWLSKLKNKFERRGKDPRSLEPASRAPCHTSDRDRIPQETESKIIELRDEYGWGKEPIAVVLKRDYGLTASSSTVNRYLHKHLRIDPKLSARNKKACLEKKLRAELAGQKMELKIKYRPPSKLKDFRPGALIEKDMKLVPTIRKRPIKSDKFYLKNHFNYQQTLLDTFTRIRGIELVEEPDSQSARWAYGEIKQRLPFKIASINTDSGGENGKNFEKQLTQDEIVHFYSRTGTPTDNSRVERSHLTDEREYSRIGLRFKTFAEQKQALKKWEHTYNWLKPNQALGYLTPMAFFKLWQQDPERAYAIKEEYQRYLNRQRRRLSSARRLKSKEQIEKLMNYIEAKLGQNQAQKVELLPYKLELIKCELCSWT